MILIDLRGVWEFNPKLFRANSFAPNILTERLTGVLRSSTSE